MLSLSEKDRANLLAILEVIQRIDKYVDGLEDAEAFYQDERTFDAALMNFVVIGETVNKLSEELRGYYSHVPWSKIKDFRNIIAHNYFGVDAEEVWQIIHNNLPILKGDVQKILEVSG